MLEYIGLCCIFLVAIWFSVWMVMSVLILLTAPYSFSDRLKLCVLYLAWPLYSLGILK